LCGQFLAHALATVVFVNFLQVLSEFCTHFFLLSCVKGEAGESLADEF
jgi:hypothetical protein